MNNDRLDQLEGRLAALEVIAFTCLGGLLSTWDFPGKPASEALKVLDNVKRGVEVETKRLNPRAAFVAMEFTDRLLSAVSEQHANNRAKAY
jgi:hypothetical protein